MAARTRDRVQSVAKVGEILGCFAPRTPVLSTRSLSRLTGIPRSTVHALCATLADAGLLEEIPGRGYALGLGLVALGGQVLHRHNLTEAADGMLAPLLVTEGSWALVGQLVDGWIVYVARYLSEHHGRVNSRTGLRVPAHRTACGKAALSILEPDEIRRRVSGACVAEHMPEPDIDTLVAELTDARSRGFVVNTEWRPGRTAIGAAIVDYRGAPVGAISLGGPSQVFTAEVMRLMSGRVPEVARRISAQLPMAAT